MEMMYYPVAAGLKIEGVLQLAATIIGGIIALVFLFAVLKDAYSLIKGDAKASVAGIVTKVLIAILLIGMVYMMVNYKSLGEKGQKAGSIIIETVDGVVDEAGK